MKEDNIEYVKKYLPKDQNLEEALQRLENGEPPQYIVGDVNFYGNTIKVNKNVLIPRRETEELVEKTLDLINKTFTKDISILDIGTGSGCIPITMKKILRNAKVDAVDISNEALEVAVDNSRLNNTNINFFQSDIFSNVKDKYDVIISNPPYIREDEPIMDIVKNNEPHIALYAEDNGLYFYKQILKEANNYLNKESIIAFEIGEEQAEDIINIAKEYFPNSLIYKEQDLTHLDRFIFILNK
jgi:release factor glutamine methyltransferase